ncbi:MAG: hypothetical protein NTU73_06260 [Ignavibacteriae bacterium]|nr:hypothetical protein [Ignavibacteriota bacterium]
MKEKIDELIKKWRDEHSKLLNEYTTSLQGEKQEVERVYSRSEMAKVLLFINDLKILRRDIQ